MPSTTRRAVLGRLGVLTGALAGCQDHPDRTRTGTSAGTDAGTRIDSRTPADTATDRPTRSETEAATETDSPEPPRRDERCDRRWNPVDRWRYATGVRSYRPTVVDGVVYFGAQGSALYAVDATDGTVRWRQDQQVRMYGRVVVDGGTAVVAAYDEVAAYDAGSGAHLWTEEIPGVVGDVQTGAAAETGRVFFAAANQPGTNEATTVPRYHRLYALDADDGGPAWTVDLPTNTGPEGIEAADGTVYLTTGDGRLLAFDAETGERSWELPVDTSIPRSRPVVGDDAVYVQTGGRVTAVDAADGRLRWRRDGRIHDGPVVGTDAVYWTTRRDLVAIDPATGRGRWRAALPKWYGEPLGATPETVFVAVEYDDRAEVLGFDAEEGCRLGRYEVPATGVTRAAVTEESVFFGGLGADGELYAVTRP